jgi:hypothetical protein
MKIIIYNLLLTIGEHDLVVKINLKNGCLLLLACANMLYR